MAKRFDFTSVYEDETWTVVFDDNEGIQDRFYEIVKDEINKSQFPGLEVSIEEYITGGIFFNKESTKMLCVKAQDSTFEQFEIYYRAQVFGNVVIFTRMECMERGFFSILAGKSGNELKAALRLKCKNMAQYEEFIAIDSLADIVFRCALQRVDPEYRERKVLNLKIA
ncbi:hypothetical protein DAY19_08435 [Halobacteriovorax vibrionivorans]|uniref:Uncharacterized protein n=1 Tax=Halobacteriovorax vibrionivorans TaxID=2152716 RepID=A0ABY0IIL5_9BACT|nr:MULTISPECIES: hypothetical protein [Halobacteriovorax]RZF21706.1 hypothetical protein DAY19_08435 [Halobacteriovorax vibrionivorans]TGD46171.1 hypothetical protein EP118_13155 [Halobacteriovorax sp. Y22]